MTPHNCNPIGLIIGLPINLCVQVSVSLNRLSLQDCIKLRICFRELEEFIETLKFKEHFIL